MQWNVIMCIPYLRHTLTSPSYLSMRCTKEQQFLEVIFHYKLPWNTCNPQEQQFCALYVNTYIHRSMHQEPHTYIDQCKIEIWLCIPPRGVKTIMYTHKHIHTCVCTYMYTPLGDIWGNIHTLLWFKIRKSLSVNHVHPISHWTLRAG